MEQKAKRSRLVKSRLWRFAFHTVTPLEICFSNRCAVMEKKRLRLLASIFMRNQVLYRAAQGARVRPSLCLA
ncbi:hypothetical protein WJX77_011263 [Trebouxia sp. C0004]